MKKSKSADLIRETLLILIIFIVAAGILFWYTGALAGILKKEVDDEVCRLSVLAQTNTKGITGKSPIKLDCPRHHITFFPKKVEKDSKELIIKLTDQKPASKFDSLNNDIINHVVAEEMRKCWRKMGKGDLSVFENSFFAGVDSVCLICSEIEFDKSVPAQIFSGLPSYLENEIPRPNEAAGKKYSDFLIKEYSGIQTTTWPPSIWFDEKSLDLDKEAKLDTGKKYFIFFKGMKFALTDFINEDRYFIFLAESDKIRQTCSILYN